VAADARNSSRPFAGDRDFARIYELTAAAPGDVLHLADLPWRLASPAARTPERTRLWERTDGALSAWAVLQFPWHCLDYDLHPDRSTVELEAAVLAWAIERLAVAAADRGERLPFYVSARAADGPRIAAIEQAGFARDDWSYVRLVRDLDRPIPAAEPPAGFVVRPLAGDAEVEAYVAAHRAAFGSTNMTAAWRRTTLRDPRHLPELDLAAIAPDGTLAGFCVCWMTPPLGSLAGRRLAQIEPLGVHPEYQRLGLGRALLLEALRRARANGAHSLEVNAESDNAASRQTYEAVGFRPEFEAPFFLRVFE
jgi:ribosomal protein S18 acetylase RimI-like enzyme